MRQRQTDQTGAGSSLSQGHAGVTPQNWMAPNSSVALLINRWLLLMGCTQPENLPADRSLSLPMHWDSHQVFVFVDACGYMSNWTKPKTEMVQFWSSKSQMRPKSIIKLACSSHKCGFRGFGICCTSQYRVQVLLGSRNYDVKWVQVTLVRERCKFNFSTNTKKD